MDDGPIDWLTERVLEALARAESVDPLALTLLLRRYCETDRVDLAEALGSALARMLDAPAFDDPFQHARWLTLLVEASKVSDDGRLRVAAADLVSSLSDGWNRVQQVELLTLSIDACLAAAELFNPRELVPKAIDELERVIGGAYRPGAGMGCTVDERQGPRGRLGDQVRSASALLGAYSSTGRLPYAMLAEELVQFANRTLWDDKAGGFFDEPPTGGAGEIRAKPFALNCEAARVLCHLAALHDSGDYRDAAVIAPGADYARDAARTLASLEPSYKQHGVDGAIYGVALGEWLARS